MSSVTLPLAELSTLIADAAVRGANGNDHVEQLAQLRDELFSLKATVAGLSALVADHLEGDTISDSAPVPSGDGTVAAASAQRPEAFDIFVKIVFIGKELTLEDVNSSETIADLKARINALEGFPLEHQILIFGGKETLDEPTVGDYRLCHGSTLHLVVRAREGRGCAARSKPFGVYVKKTTGKTLTLADVSSSEGVADIKARLHAMGEWPPHQQRLIFAGKVLDAERTVGDYGIVDDDTVHLVYMLRGR